MSAKLTLEQVRHVAKLASLELNEADASALMVDLASILQHVASLDHLDVSGVEPTLHPTRIAGSLRPDQRVECQPREVYLAAAPETAQGGFAVPKVLDGD
jgi:aspartyl-tRNA(Asn)/glutamyl-tRNA(Gln) amidotransferase subunit C